MKWLYENVANLECLVERIIFFQLMEFGEMRSIDFEVNIHKSCSDVSPIIIYDVVYMFNVRS